MVMSARAAAPIDGSLLILNNNRLEGNSGYFFNSIIEATKLNITIWPTFHGDRSRDSDGNLTDVIGELARNKAEFGLYPCPLFLFEASEDEAVLFGPVLTSESFAIATVYVQEDSHEITQDAVEAIFKLSTSAIVLITIPLMCIIVHQLCTISNWRLGKRFKLTSSRKWKYHGWKVIRLTLFLSFFWACQFYYNSMCTSIMVKPKLDQLDTIRQLADSNNTFLRYLGGIPVYEWFEYSSDQSKKVLYARTLRQGINESCTKSFATKHIVSTIEKLIEGYATGHPQAFIGISMAIEIMSIFMCMFPPSMQIEYKMHGSVEKLFKWPWLTIYSKSVTPELRSRLDVIFYRLYESGLYQKFEIDRPHLLFPCQDDCVNKCLRIDHVSINMVKTSSLDNFRLLFRAATIGMLVSLGFIATEVVIRKRYRSRRRRNRDNATLAAMKVYNLNLRNAKKLTSRRRSRFHHGYGNHVNRNNTRVSDIN